MDAPTTPPTKAPLNKVDRSRFYSAFEDRVILQLTSQCNLGCGHCLFKLKPTKTPQVLDPGDVKSLLGSLDPEHEVFLAGGEPTLHPQFFNIAKQLGRFRSATVITNGHWLRTPAEAADFLARLPKNVVVRLSIDRFHEKKMPDLKKRTQLLRDACAALGRKCEFSLTTSSPREDAHYMREYGLPEDQVVHRPLMKPEQAGSTRSLFVNYDGRLFDSENAFHRRQEPFGTLREGIRPALRRAGFYKVPERRAR